MSFAVEKEAWSLIESGQFKLTPSDKLVLMKVAFWCNADHECWHGQGKLADACGLDPKTVNVALLKLNSLGILDKRPRMQSSGRGRAANSIVFVPSAANGKSLRLDLDDQTGIYDAAEGNLPPQQTGKQGGGTNKASEKESESTSDRGAGAGRDRRRTLPKINRHSVTEDEWDQAVAILDRFNDRNGSKLRLLGKTGEPTDSMTRIIVRTRQHPELETEDYLRIIDRNFDAPWWTESKLGGVGPIFGPNAWPRAQANDGVIKNNSGRKVRLDIDRPITKEDLEDEPW